MGQQITTALSQSTHRVLQMLVNFLPGVLAFLLALVIFTIIGVALKAVIRRILTGLRFDERLASHQPDGVATNFTDWSPSHSPSLLVARATLWVCVLIGLAVGISAFNAAYSNDSQLSVVLLPYLTHITGAVLLVLAGNLLARFLARSVLIGAVNAQLHYARFLSLGIKWLVLVLTAAMALDHLQIGGSIVELAFGILFGGIVLTLALAVGLGSRDLVSRSLEKTMEKPLGPTVVETPTAVHPEPELRPRLRHF